MITENNYARFAFQFTRAPYNKDHKIFCVVQVRPLEADQTAEIKNIRYRFVGRSYDLFELWFVPEHVDHVQLYRRLGGIHLIAGWWDPETMFSISALIMGFYTIWMSKFVKDGGKIHSFEPDAGTYERLNKNIGSTGSNLLWNQT